MKDNKKEISTQKMFLDLGVMKEGHFVLTSGRHSSFYFEKFRILEKPEMTSALCSKIAEIVKKEIGKKIDLICGPATGGMILAFEVARILRLGCIYLEKSGDGFCLLRGMRFPTRSRILIVDDVLTTGKSLKAAEDAVREAGGEVIAFAVMIDRRKDKNSVPNVLALHKAEGEDYAPDECPQCASNVPLINPKTGEEILRR